MSDCIYSPDSKLPLLTLLGLALQYVCTVSSFLILTIMVMSAAHVSDTIARGAVSISMILCGVSSLLQAIKTRWFGAGLFAAATPNPAYLMPALMATKLGGIGLLAGMMLYASAIQAILAPFINRLKSFFPTEIAALLISLIGAELGIMGMRSFQGLLADPSYTYSDISICIISLAAIVIIHVSNYRTIRFFSLLIGLTTGYLLSIFFGSPDPFLLSSLHNLPWVELPHWQPIHYKFSKELLIPFTIAAVVCTTKVMGSIAALQEAQGKYDFDTQQMTSTALADSVINVFTGVFGCLGFNFSSSTMAISVNNKIFSRIVSYPFAIIFLILAFCPKIGCLFVHIPKSVTAAVLLFLGATLLVNGLSLISKKLETIEQRIIISMSFMVGICHLIAPEQYADLHRVVKYFTSSSLTIALMLALILQACCRMHKNMSNQQ